jgi:hypothetical protein
VNPDPSLVVALRQQSVPERVRSMADLLHDFNDPETVHSVALALDVLAAELERDRDAQCIP